MSSVLASPNTSSMLVGKLRILHSPLYMGSGVLGVLSQWYITLFAGWLFSVEKMRMSEMYYGQLF